MEGSSKPYEQPLMFHDYLPSPTMSEFAAGSVKTFNNTFKHQPASDVHQLPHDYYQSLIRDDWDLAEDSLSEWTQTFELSAKGSDDVMDKQSIKPKSRSKVNEDKVKEAHHEVRSNQSSK